MSAIRPGPAARTAAASPGTKADFPGKYAGAALAKRLTLAPLLPERLLVEYELLPELPYSVEALLLGWRLATGRFGWGGVWR